MTERGSVAVPLSRHHCRATAWWLLQRFIPSALERWRCTGSDDDGVALATAVRLAEVFEGFGKRLLKGEDQDRDADRTLTRRDVAWLASMILNGHIPQVVPWVGELPSNDQFAAMPFPAAQAILFGLGADETMRRCHDRVYSRRSGPKRKLLTEEEVERRQIGNAAEGGDERYERRLRKRAKEDEIAAELAVEFDRAIRTLEARRAAHAQNSDNSYPPAIDHAR